MAWEDVFHVEADWDIKPLEKACKAEIREKCDRSDIVHVFKYKKISPQSKKDGFS